MKSFYPSYNHSYGYLRAFVTLILGIVLIIWPGIVEKTIVTVLGGLILAIGIASLIIAYAIKSKIEKNSLLSINGFVDIAFGLVLIIFPSFFSGFIMFLFGFALLVFGIGEIVGLFITKRQIKIPLTLFIGPILTSLCGITMFFNPFEASKWLFIFFGISLIIYSISEFLSTIIVHSIQKNMPEEVVVEEEGEKVAINAGEVEDADFEEVER